MLLVGKFYGASSARTDYTLYQVDDSHITWGTGPSTSNDAWMGAIHPISFNQWYHIVSTYSTLSNLKNIFVNGVLINQTGLGAKNPSNDSPLIFGREVDRNYLHGKLDELRIYERALSTDEIKALANLSYLDSETTGIHKLDLNSSVSMDMIWCPPGTFTMGSPTSESGRSSDETQHQVTLTQGFYLGKYEVTQAQYEAVMTGNTETDSNGNVISATPSQWPNNPDRPVEKVSWDDIQVFLTRLNAQEAGSIPAGWAYVLPTEAQWEYACRAGTTTAYSWGDTITRDNANYLDSGYSKTRDVGLHDANPWGFFDMHGNVWEWTADMYRIRSLKKQVRERLAGMRNYRLLKGGSFLCHRSYCYRYRIAARSGNSPDSTTTHQGFRVVWDV